REDFAKRWKAEQGSTLLEVIEPLLQGYDSVAVKADVELGGTDQLFNLLMGREVQRDHGQDPQVVMTLPLLIGTDGVRKMSKSYGNTIAFSDSPDMMYGKIMSLSDTLMWQYYELLTDHDLASVKQQHPREAKAALARELTTRFHGQEAAEKAEAAFVRVFTDRQAPERLEEHVASRNPIPLSELLVESGLAPSKKEARRLLQQGGVELDGQTVKSDQEITVNAPVVVKVGKRRFRKILGT
ncbi:MAG: tyrosine--tRNA ligase, partial [Elusimicrobia bacterium]|nr:tyrosine--tRNA ligase [Elusimicrobiota bacterium]